MEAVKPPPAPRTDALNKVNPLLDEALAQNPRASREFTRSSQDNLAACAGNTSEQSDIPVPHPFTPPSQKAGEGAKIKKTRRPKRLRKETNAPQASLVQCIPPVSPLTVQRSQGHYVSIIKNKGRCLWKTVGGQRECLEGVQTLKRSKT